MNPNEIVFTNKGQWFYQPNWPEKPIKGFYDNIDPYDKFAYSNALEKYHEECQQAISTAIPFKEKGDIEKLKFELARVNNHPVLSHINEDYKPEDLPYELPEGIDVEVGTCGTEEHGCNIKWRTHNDDKICGLNRCKEPFAFLTQVKEHLPKLFGTESERDWQEDLSHENGNYTNKCIECGLFFWGHKRRVICKKCATPDWIELSKRKRPEDTKDNKAWSGAWLEGEMVGYAKCMVEKVLPKQQEHPENQDELWKEVKNVFGAWTGDLSKKIEELKSKFKIERK